MSLRRCLSRPVPIWRRWRRAPHCQGGVYLQMSMLQASFSAIATDVTAAVKRNPAGCHSVTLPKIPSPLRKKRTLNLHAQTSPVSQEHSKMDFTLRAANVDDCKDIARMILVRFAGGHATLVPGALRPPLLSEPRTVTSPRSLWREKRKRGHIPGAHMWVE